MQDDKNNKLDDQVKVNENEKKNNEIEK